MTKQTSRQRERIIGEILSILALPSALPIATGGIAHAMSIPIIIVTVYGLLFEKIDVSDKKSRILQARDTVLSIKKLRDFHDKVWHQAGKISRERCGRLFDSRLFRNITAIFIILCTVCFWTIIPLADTPPSIAVMLFGISLVHRDIIIWIMATIVGIIGVAINVGTLYMVLSTAITWVQMLL